MRFNEARAAVRSQVAALVHASVPPDCAERFQHECFMATRLGLGVLSLSLIPAYLLLRGGIGLLETLILVAIVLPLAAVVVLSRTGRLDTAHAISAAALTLFVVAVSCMAGGVASPALVWLAAVPAEAVFFGNRAFVLRASLIAMLGLAALVALQAVGFVADPAPWAAAAMPAFVAAAILHAALIAVALLHRRESETREHRAADARAHLLLETVGDLVTWHDAGGAVVYANPASRALLDAGPGEILGRGLLARVHVADRPLFLSTLSAAAHGEGCLTASFRVVYMAKDEAGTGLPVPTARWLEMSAQRIAHADPRSGAAVVCVMRDVTRRRETEDARERGLIEAEKANGVKLQFLATVSHELRTPLNAIIGFSEMLSSDMTGFLDEAKRREYATIIHSSGHHLLDVVNTLLDVSKIEMGAMTLNREPVDLARLGQDCVALMAIRAADGKVALETVFGGDLPEIMADRRALKQVLINLLSNAIKFTPSGGKVTLAVLRDARSIDIAVADTGIGIAESDLPRLGDPFFQAKGSYDRSHEGTGLGLSVVRGLVGLHGGTMTIESAPGKGTRVAVRLPLGLKAQGGEPVRIATHARAPRRAIDSKPPLRLTA